MQPRSAPAPRRVLISDRYKRIAGPPLAGLGLVFLGAYAWPILSPGLGAGWRATLGDVSVAVWILFVVDYLARLFLATNRSQFVRGNWFDLVVILVPMARPLRSVRALMALRVVARGGSTIGRRDAVVSVVVAMIAGGAIAALAMLDAERQNPGANIKSYSDALWWALTTMSTIGYGDRYPTTMEGRFVAAALMLGGVALLGVVTAALASWFVDRFGQASKSDAALLDALGQLQVEVAALREELHFNVAQVGTTMHSPIQPPVQPSDRTPEVLLRQAQTL
jgi:voltage-gated potassium channel